MLRIVSALALGILPMVALANSPALSASGAVLRALNKINGQTVDLNMKSGEIKHFGDLKITLVECRYPEGNRTGDSYAALEIAEIGKSDAVFSGWMIASSPALHSMEHARYDVWVLRCTTS